MKYVIVIVLFGLMLAGPTSAATANDPGILPDSPFYALKRLGENVGTFFTFNKAEKAERLSGLAELRIAEAQEMIKKGKTEHATRAVQDYERQIRKATSYVDALEQGTAKTTAAAESVSETAVQQQKILTTLFNEVPETATGAIGEAITTSSQGFSTAVEAIPAEDRELFFEAMEGASVEIQTAVTEMQAQGVTAPSFTTINIQPLKGQAIEVPVPDALLNVDTDALLDSATGAVDAQSSTSNTQNSSSGKTFELKVIGPSIAR